MLPPIPTASRVHNEGATGSTPGRRTQGFRDQRFVASPQSQVPGSKLKTVERSSAHVPSKPILGSTYAPARSPYAGEQKLRSPFSNIEMNMEGGSGDHEEEEEPTKAEPEPVEENQYPKDR